MLSPKKKTKKSKHSNKKFNRKGSRAFALIRKYWTEKFKESEDIDHKKTLKRFMKKNTKTKIKASTLFPCTNSSDSVIKTKQRLIIPKNVPDCEDPKFTMNQESEPSSKKNKKQKNKNFDSLSSEKKKKKKFSNAENMALTQSLSKLTDESYSSLSKENVEAEKKKKKKKKSISQSSDDIKQNSISPKKEKLNSFNNIETVPTLISENDNSQRSNDSYYNSLAKNSYMSNESPEIQNKKKKKKKKKNPQSNSTLNQSTSANETITEENNVEVIKKNKKKKKKTNLQAATQNDTNIDDPTEVKTQKKLKRSLSESINESEMSPVPKKIKKENETLLSRTKKKLKMKDKKLIEDIPGLHNEPELVKFSAKLQSDEGNDDSPAAFPRRPKFDSPEKTNRTLFVGNLPVSTNKKRLIEVFRPFGKVESVRVRNAVPPKPSMSKKAANIKQEYHTDMKSLKAYVVFSNKEEAESALSLNGKTFNGHHLRVDKAIPRRYPGGPEPSTPRCDDNASVFVGNLPFTVEDEVLWNTFSNCGTVKNVRVVRDSTTGLSKGFAFVEFQDKDSIKSALSKNDTDIGGRSIRVKRIENKNRSPPKFNSPRNEQVSGKPKSFRFKKFHPKKEQDSSSKKSFKKMNKKIKVENEKKKIAASFNF